MAAINLGENIIEITIMRGFGAEINAFLHFKNTGKVKTKPIRY